MKWMLVLLLIIPAAYAWNCETHQYICDKAGYGGFNCCSADNNDFRKSHPYTSPYYHHCTDNNDDCEARKAADYYLNNTDRESIEIYLHLLSDAMVPVHWYSTDYDRCHGPFEDAVDQKLSMFGDWKVVYECPLKNGLIYRITMDKEYLDHVADYVKNYTQGIPANKTSSYVKIEDCTGRECGFVIPYPEKIKMLVIIAFLAFLLTMAYRNRKFFS